MDRLTDNFDVVSLLPSLQFGSKTCLFCNLVITSKEASNTISVSTMETLKKSHGIAEKWSKIKLVSSCAKNYDFVWGRIKNLDTQSENYQGIMWAIYATYRCDFQNTKKLETNSKQKINK